MLILRKWKIKKKINIYVLKCNYYLNVKCWQSFTLLKKKKLFMFKVNVYIKYINIIIKSLNFWYFLEKSHTVTLMMIKKFPLKGSHVIGNPLNAGNALNNKV